MFRDSHDRNSQDFYNRLHVPTHQSNIRVEQNISREKKIVRQGTKHGLII